MALFPCNVGGTSIKAPQVIIGSANNSSTASGDTSATITPVDNLTIYVAVGNKTRLTLNVSGQSTGSGGMRIVKLKKDGTFDKEIMYIGVPFDVSGYEIVYGVVFSSSAYIGQSCTCTLS